MKYIVLAGRILFSLIFIMTIKSHFGEQAVAYAAAKGVPFPGLLVPLSGIIAIAGGLSILTGYKARVGGWLIVLFLVPVTLFMHDFWNETDAMQMQMQMGGFIKNLALIGGALMISYFGSGELSLDKKVLQIGQIKIPGEKENLSHA